ncbi:hypothetical protein EDD86DRAFT_196736 [Gorgonomyces haynaldii]|nr:hypothetical protein EDD86DRAFT_196736 [Gorgonomyces haynaldii]
MLPFTLLTAIHSQSVKINPNLNTTCSDAVKSSLVQLTAACGGNQTLFADGNYDLLFATEIFLGSPDLLATWCSPNCKNAINVWANTLVPKCRQNILLEGTDIPAGNWVPSHTYLSSLFCLKDGTDFCASIISNDLKKKGLDPKNETTFMPAVAKYLQDENVFCTTCVNKTIAVLEKNFVDKFKTVVDTLSDAFDQVCLSNLTTTPGPILVNSAPSYSFAALLILFFLW